MKKAVIWLLAIGFAIVFGYFVAHAGEKEDLALKIFTLQEETQALQNAFQEKQKGFIKDREALKKETDPKKKGEMAVKVITEEQELVDLAAKANAKGEEQRIAREKFKAMIDKEVKK
jgi:hypothetical protein